MNIIADVAGRYEELLELLKIMPHEEKLVLVGDIIDRGPMSKEVVDFAMNDPYVITLKGNHEEMFVNDPLLSRSNGGLTTLESFGVKSHQEIPKKYMDWFNSLPIFHKEDGIFISHAPWFSSVELGEIWMNEWRMLWNHYPPRNHPGILQVFGHNTVIEKYEDDNDKLYAICIDDSGYKKLTGFHWPSQKIYQVDYLS